MVVARADLDLQVVGELVAHFGKHRLVLADRADEDVLSHLGGLLVETEYTDWREAVVVTLGVDVAILPVVEEDAANGPFERPVIHRHQGQFA